MKMQKKIRDVLRHPEVRCQAGLLLLMLLSCVLIFRSYLLGDELMVFDDIGSDTWQQYTMQYASIVNHLRNGTFSLWDFTNGFGVSLFNSNLFDPTLLLLYGIGVVLGPAHMMIYISWVQVLRILAAGYVFYHFLGKFPFSRSSRVAAAYVYSLNGYLLVWGQHYQFGIVTIYLPLLLLFAEKFLRKEKGGKLFPAAVFLCAVDSVYFSYMTLAAVGFYLLFRIWMEEGWMLKERITCFFGGCVRILFGVALSAAAFLPNVSCLLNVSDRITEGGNGIVWWLENLLSVYPKAYYRMLQMRLISSHLENGDFLMDGEGTYWNYYEAPVLFCGTLTFFLCIQFLAVFWRSQASVRKKAAVYTAAGMMILCVLMPWGGTMFNAFVAPSHRYTFVLMPFLVLAAVWMWEYLRARRKCSWVMLAVTEGFLLYVTWSGHRNSVLMVYKRNAVILAVTGTVMALCIGTVAIAKNRRVCEIAAAVLAVAMAVNILSESAAGYTDRVTMRKEDTPAQEMEERAAQYQAYAEEYGDRKAREAFDRPQDYFRTMYFPQMQEIREYLKERDPEFYRMEKDYSAGTIAMDSLAQGYRGISSYNSVMNGNIRRFVDVCYPELCYPDKNHFVFWKNSDDHWMASFMGVRYLVSRDSNVDSSKYRFLKQFGTLYLYENTLETNMARFYDTAISEESLTALCTGDTREELLGSAIAVEGGTEITSLSELKKLKEAGQKEEAEASFAVLDDPVKDSLLTGRIEAVGDGYVMFMIPYEKGWSLTLNGEDTELIRGDLGFLACAVKEGTYELKLTYHPPLLREGAAVSILAWMLYILWMAGTRRGRKKIKEYM